MRKFCSLRSIAFFLTVLFLNLIFVQAQTPTVEVSKNETQSSDNASSSIDENLLLKSDDEGVSSDSDFVGEIKPARRGYWGAYASTFTVYNNIVGQSARARFGFAAARYVRVLTENSSVKWCYMMDYVPFALINYEQEQLVQTTLTAVGVVREKKTAYGAGFTPLIAQINFRNSKKIQPFLASGAGIFFFNKFVPDNRSELQPRARGGKLNFTADFGGGLEFLLKDKKSFFVGYKYHHISNFSTAPINDGFNTNMFYTGIYFSN